jgi:hypothetical protein
VSYKPLKYSRRYKQGTYKERGYDSSWELRHMQSLDARGLHYERNTTIGIPYYNPVKARPATYVPDYVVYLGRLVYLQEVKPPDKRRDPEVMAKAEAARAWCLRKSAETGQEWRYVFVRPGQISGEE